MDIYVDPATGTDDDADFRGQVASPYRSLARAAERAAQEELASGLPPGSFLGTIFAAAGTYAPPVEGFPIIVPPSYDLIGAGSERSIIEFTGETRTTTDPTPVTYWGGEAVYVGRAMRGLTVRARPAPSYTCRGMIGVQVQNDRSTVEDVTVDFDRTTSPPADDRGRYDLSWMLNLFATSIDLVLLSSTFRDGRGTNFGVTLRGCTGMVTRCTFETAGPTFDGDPGGLLVRDIAVRGAGSCEVRRHARLEASQIGDLAFSPFTNLWVSREGAVVGPGNTVEAINIFAFGDVAIVGNSLSHGFTFQVTGGVHVADNDIVPWAAHRLLEIEYNPFFSGIPVIERNRFVAPERIGGHYVNPIVVRASADFGGGTSAGGNDFGALFQSPSSVARSTPDGPERWGVIAIDPDETPVSVIRFDDNLWDDLYPLDRIERSRFQIITPPTFLSIANPMPAP